MIPNDIYSTLDSKRYKFQQTFRKLYFALEFSLLRLTVILLERTKTFDTSESRANSIAYRYCCCDIDKSRTDSSLRKTIRGEFIRRTLLVTVSIAKLRKLLKTFSAIFPSPTNSSHPSLACSIWLIYSYKGRFSPRWDRSDLHYMHARNRNFVVLITMPFFGVFRY